MPGSSTDKADTQPWALQPDNYIDTWLAEQRAEHAARIEAAAAAAARDAELQRQEAIKARLRRREQLEDEDVGKPVTKLELMCKTSAL